MLAMAPSGFVALLAGWTVTEVGRQPFTVYGLLRTADSVSPIGLPGVAGSLAGFIVVYLIVFGAGFVFLSRLMRRPPTVGESGPPSGIPIRSAGITPAAALHDGARHDPDVDLGLPDRLRRAGLCVARRVRPRRRDPVRGRTARTRIAT